MENLLNKQIKDIKQPRQIQTLYAWNTVKEFIIKLKTTKIYSFPVLDENNECIGIIDELV